MGRSLFVHIYDRRNTAHKLLLIWLDFTSYMLLNVYNTWDLTLSEWVDALSKMWCIYFILETLSLWKIGILYYYISAIMFYIRKVHNILTTFPSASVELFYQSTIWLWGNYLTASAILFSKNSNEATRLDDFENTPRLMVDVSTGRTIAFRNIYEVNIMVGYLLFIMR